MAAEIMAGGGGANERDSMAVRQMVEMIKV
jgi:hypothetical protein